MWPRAFGVNKKIHPERKKLFSLKYSDPHPLSDLHTHTFATPNRASAACYVQLPIVLSFPDRKRGGTLSLSRMQRVTCGKDSALTREICISPTPTCYFNKPTVAGKRKIKIKQKTHSTITNRRILSLACLPL